MLQAKYARGMALVLGPSSRSGNPLRTGRNQIIRPFSQLFLLRDLQHVTKVTLDRSFDSLVPLDVLQVSRC